MLDFHLGRGGCKDIGKHIGGLDSGAIYWLQHNGFLEEGATGHLPDSPETLPYYDDVILTHEQVLKMYRKFVLRLESVAETPGFQSSHVDTLGEILFRAVENGAGLSTLAD